MDIAGDYLKEHMKEQKEIEEKSVQLLKIIVEQKERIMELEVEREKEKIETMKRTIHMLEVDMKKEKA